MALPKRRHSKTRGRKRRGAKSWPTPTLVACSECASPIHPHTACRKCGAWKGQRQVIKAKENY